MYDDSVNIHVLYSGSYEYSRLANPLGIEQGTWIIKKRYEQYLFEKDICIYIRGIDTVFSVNYENNYSKSDRYVVKTGKYHFSKEMDIKDSSIDPITLNAISLERLLEFETYLFLEFDFRGLAPESFENERGSRRLISSNYNTTVYAVYNKTTGELSILNQPSPGTLGLKNDIDNGVIFWPKTVSDSYKPVSWYNASDLILLAEEEKIDRNIIGNLKENDNPVIVIATLKL